MNRFAGCGTDQADHLYHVQVLLRDMVLVALTTVTCCYCLRSRGIFASVDSSEELRNRLPNRESGVPWAHLSFSESEAPYNQRAILHTMPTPSTCIIIGRSAYGLLLVPENSLLQWAVVEASVPAHNQLDASLYIFMD